jgi:RHS repeat-associated protein
MVVKSSGTVIATQGYYPYGETRYSTGSLFTDRLYTGQQQNSYIKLYWYGSRWYDPALGRFIQPDTIIPDSSPQSLNRFSYTNNNPINFIDLSGHKACESHDGTECDWRTPYLWDQAERILGLLGGKNDLEAMARIIEAGARVYNNFSTLLPALSSVFLGVETSGPGTLVAAVKLAGQYGCAGVGREPRDCSTNTEYFSDTGFHSDFRDFHNQLYHLWGYIANTAAPGNHIAGFAGTLVGVQANGFHEQDQSIIASTARKLGFDDWADDKGWGTSWQDYVLSEAGMRIGALITDQTIAPRELANIIRHTIGPQGPGSNGRLQRLQNYYGPLYGSP